MNSNMPPGYSDDGDCATHGRDTVVYQELLDVLNKYNHWLYRNERDLFNDELIAKAARIRELMEEISEELNAPL